jgi:aspartate kinase
MKDVVVCGAAIAKDEVRIFLDSVPDRPGTSHRIFSAIAETNIAVDMIAQSAGSGGKAAIGFTVMRNDLNLTLSTLKPIADDLGATIRPAEDVSKVSIVGTGMRTHSGVAEKMFASLAKEEVNIKMITTGDIKISVLVDRNDGGKALKAVHQAFVLQNPRTGAGLPGGPAPQDFKDRPLPRGDEASRDLSLATQRLVGMEDIVISGVQLSPDYGRITIFDLPNLPGNCSKVFEAVATSGIMVDTIVQNLNGPTHAELSFTVPKSDLRRALIRTQDVMREINPQAKIAGDSDIAVLYVFGVGMRTHTGVARKMFGALAEKGINITMITTSEVCVSVVVELARGQEALECLKRAFQV